MVGSEHGPNDVKSMGVHGNSIEKSHGRTEKHEKRTGAMMMKNVVKEVSKDVRVLPFITSNKQGAPANFLSRDFEEN